MAQSAVSGVPGEPASWGPCGASAWASDTGAAAQNLVLNDGARQANAAVTLFGASNTAAIAAQHAFTSSPQVLPCLKQFASFDALRYPWLGYTDPSQYSAGASPITLRTLGDSELLTIAATVAGSPRTASWVFAHQYVDRYEAVTVVTWCTCTPLTTGDVQHLEDAVGSHLMALAQTSP